MKKIREKLKTLETLVPVEVREGGSDRVLNRIL